MTSLRLYIGGVDKYVRDKDLLRHFEKYYPRSVEVKNGFAFMDFADARNLYFSCQNIINLFNLFLFFLFHKCCINVLFNNV
jgi:RNA recognition motif-containing protein